MESIDKKEIESVLGKRNKWLPKKLINSLTYISGFTEIDEDIKSSSSLMKDLNILVGLEIYEKGVHINVMRSFRKKHFALASQDIKGVAIERQEKIVEEKSKSVVGRAVLGGVLLGPLGAVVGGMSGIGSKKIDLTPVANIVSISYENNGIEEMLLFGCDNKKLKLVTQFIKKHFK